MTLLLDTNALIWWLLDDSRLGTRALQDISSPSSRVYVSDLVFLELAIKVRIKKLNIGMDFRELADRLARDSIQQTSFEAWAAESFTRLPDMDWADPFDRAHIALALAKHMTLVTADNKMLAVSVPNLKIMDARK